LYELVGDTGKKNGEKARALRCAARWTKRAARALTVVRGPVRSLALACAVPQKLRALLARCSEWRADEARLALAQALDAQPDNARLASCLRGACDARARAPRGALLPTARCSPPA
jgi:hypothetical protein